MNAEGHTVHTIHLNKIHASTISYYKVRKGGRGRREGERKYGAHHFCTPLRIWKHGVLPT